MREGSALLQGLVTRGHCGRRLHVHYRGRNSAPGYHCSGKDFVNGRGVYCLNVGGAAIEQAVADAFLEAITPAAIQAVRLSIEQLEANHHAALSQWRLEVERARYEAERAERRYRSGEPENRLVARGLEAEWEKRLRDLAAAEAELRGREQQRPRVLGPEQLERMQCSHRFLNNQGAVWNTIEEALDIRIQNPVHPLPGNPHIQRIERLMRVTPWPEPVRKAPEVHLVNLVEDGEAAW